MLSQITKRKFIETYPGNGRKILTPLGYKEIEYIHKTIPYEKYRLKTDDYTRGKCQYIKSGLINLIIVLKNALILKLIN